ncbi:hypothetical protein F5Y15DRAFT_428273 [Xylariaceae sp. FL0016]|nr:hypothetical protein F5Y15DRAFT_428273 [Xylariaceae sp. FL0016]
MRSVSRAPNQLEGKLKSWGFRKNLSQDEWPTVLDELDRIENDGRSGRLCISGVPVTSETIRSAKKHYRRNRARARKTLSRHHLRQVRIDIQAGSGEWALYKHFSQQVDSIHPPQSSEQSSSSTQGPAHGNISAAAVHASQPVELNRIPIIGDLSSQDFECDITNQPQIHDIGLGWPSAPLQFDDPFFNTNMSPMWDLSPYNCQQYAEQEILQPVIGGSCLQSGHKVPYLGHYSQGPETSLQDIALIGPSHEPLEIGQGALLPGYKGSALLKDLAFERFEHALATKGIIISSPWRITPPMGRTQVQPTIASALNLGKQSRTHLSIRTRKQDDDLPRRLQSFIPSSGSENEAWSSSGCLIGQEEADQTNFNRSLIAAIANGFAGLQAIQIPQALRHLVHYRHTTSTLLHFLREDQSHMAKALAENLFRAAIEARDVTALQAMLTVPSVDVDSIRINVRGRIYTPLCRAVSLLSLGMVRALLKAENDTKAAVNTGLKDHDKQRSTEQNPVQTLMGKLQSMWHQVDEFTDQEIAIVFQELITAGYKLTKHMLVGIPLERRNPHFRAITQCWPNVYALLATNWIV